MHWRGYDHSTHHSLILDSLEPVVTLLSPNQDNLVNVNIKDFCSGFLDYLRVNDSWMTLGGET